MFRMPVEDVFFLTNRGLVATGRIESGTVRTGEEVRINDRGAARVTGIEMFRKVLDEGIAGDAVGIWLEGIDRDDLKSGDVLTRDAPAPQDPTQAVPPAPDATATQDAANRALGRD